jgi:predicted DNA-binding transcriptional regulator AlpA
MPNNQPIEDDDLITTKEAAAMLHMSPATLDTWRCRGKRDLPFIKLSAKIIRYRVGDVREFIKSRTSAVTA